MEDILAVILFFVAASITGLFIRHLLKSHAAKVAEEQNTYEVERARIKKVAQERTLARMAASNTPPPKRLDVYASGVGVGRSTYTPQPVQSSSVLSDIADVAMIANTVRHWNDTPHRTNTDNPIDFPKEERSVGVTKSESSWGFDDSDSRKSVSDTFGSSSSDSSWSSSSSSDSFSSSASSDW